MALLIVVFHFALPFALLLSRRLKRDPRRARPASRSSSSLMRFVDLFWLVTPAWEPAHGSASTCSTSRRCWRMGGFWIWFFVRQLEGRPLLPLRDPVNPVVR